MLCHRIVLAAFLLWSSSALADDFIPPNGGKFLFIGQDQKTIEDYVRTTGHKPAGFMLYTSIQDLTGLSASVDYGAGINHGQYLVDHYPGARLQIGLYMVDALDDILSGKYDANIKKLGQWIKKSKRPVYLRIGYEFDLPNNHYDPEAYKQAFRYIVDHLRKQRVKNVAFVWHSYGYLNPEKPLMSWYPGDEYVDFFGVSLFKAFNTGNMNFILKRARERGKPFMIAESTPSGIGTGGGEKSWNLWFKPYFQFINDNGIPVVCYINSDWESLPMFANQGWGDARIQANPVVKERWLKEVLSERYINLP